MDTKTLENGIKVLKDPAATAARITEAMNSVGQSADAARAAAAAARSAIADDPELILDGKRLAAAKARIGEAEDLEQALDSLLAGLAKKLPTAQAAENAKRLDALEAIGRRAVDASLKDCERSATLLGELVVVLSRIQGREALLSKVNAEFNNAGDPRRVDSVHQARAGVIGSQQWSDFFVSRTKLFEPGSGEPMFPPSRYGDQVELDKIAAEARKAITGDVEI